MVIPIDSNSFHSDTIDQQHQSYNMSSRRVKTLLNSTTLTRVCGDTREVFAVFLQSLCMCRGNWHGDVAIKELNLDEESDSDNMAQLQAFKLEV